VKDHGLVRQPLAEAETALGHAAALLANDENDAEIARDADATAAAQIKPTGQFA